MGKKERVERRRSGRASSGRKSYKEDSSSESESEDEEESSEVRARVCICV